MSSTCEGLGNDSKDAECRAVTAAESDENHSPGSARIQCESRSPRLPDLKKIGPVQARTIKNGSAPSSGSTVRTCTEITVRGSAGGSGTEAVGKGPKTSGFFELDEVTEAVDLQSALNLNGMEALLFAATSH